MRTKLFAALISTDKDNEDDEEEVGDKVSDLVDDNVGVTTEMFDEKTCGKSMLLAIDFKTGLALNSSVLFQISLLKKKKRLFYLFTCNYILTYLLKESVSLREVNDSIGSNSDSILTR